MKSPPRITLFLGLVSLFTVLIAPRAVDAGEKEKTPPSGVTHASATEAAQLVANGKVSVLDVRTPKEFAAGHVAGATNIDFRAPDFAVQLGKLDKDKAYLVHCATGRRSTDALPTLERLGFKRIIHLDGGIKAWEKAGNPVAKKSE